MDIYINSYVQFIIVGSILEVLTEDAFKNKLIN